MSGKDRLAPMPRTQRLERIVVKDSNADIEMEEGSNAVDGEKAERDEKPKTQADFRALLLKKKT